MLRPDRCLQRDEITAVLEHLHRKSSHYANGKHSPSRWTSIAIFRLSCCCGLRSKEIIGLECRDVQLVGPRPYIRVRDTKGYRNAKGEYQSDERYVPLTWDLGTLQDLQGYMEMRRKQGAGAKDRYVASQCCRTKLQPFTRSGLRHRWRRCLAALPPDRASQLSIHTGRHTFCTACFWAGRPLDQIRLAMGHKSVATTSVYAHGWDRPGVPDLFS